MRAPVSVIIPTLDAAAELPATLAALREALVCGLVGEIIVSDGGSRDVTLALAKAAGALIVTGPASRGGQLRRGCARARGDWLLIVHADTRLAAGWAKVVSAHLESSQRPACFHLAFRAPGAAARMVAAWGNLRTRVFALPYGDQGLLLRRSDYEAVGGYPDMPLMEDVALARRLPRQVCLPAAASTGARRYLGEGWFRRGARNLHMLLSYWLGADPSQLAARYEHRQSGRRKPGRGQAPVNSSQDIAGCNSAGENARAVGHDE